MKGHGAMIAVIVVLLIIQAYCDLALPDYTSDLLNVGLQQNGIEYAAPNTIRSDTLEELSLFLTDSDYSEIDSAYDTADSNGIRKLSSDADIDRVSELLMMPESMLFQMKAAANSEISANTETQMPDLDMIKAAIAAGQMTKEQFLEGINEKMAQYEDMKDTYLKQVAVAFVAEEYTAQGVDLDEIRSSYLWKVGGKMILMSLFMSITAVLTGLLAAKISAKIGMSLREQIFGKVMRFTNAEMEHFSTASLITRSTNDIQQIQMVTVMLLRMVAYAPILAIFGIIHIIDTGSEMSWIIVLAVILLSASVGVLMAVAMPKFKKMQSLVDRLNLVSRELLTGILPIRAFNREKHEEDRFAKANKDLFDTQLFTNRTMTFMMPLMMFIMNGVSVLIVWVGGHKVDLGTIQVGDLTAFITYSMVIVMSFLMLSMISIMLPRAGVAADRIAEVIDMPISITDSENAETISDVKGRLVFDHVDFRYPNADETALTDISFSAEPGQVTAIIGSTGCGKSTLLNLIPRFFDVSGGNITLDGTDIRKLTQSSLRDAIGYVPQKGMLFSGTIESNLRYAGDTVTDEDMKQAAQIAQAEEFISEKPEGYGSAIAQEGSNVSGGQRQRLSIARAIAKHPKIYLFDDSFSALDYKTDLKLRSELNKHTGDATVIIVAQRISTILHADKILVMDEGMIVGQGTHDELMKSCGTYIEIAKSQLSEAELAGKAGA